MIKAHNLTEFVAANAALQMPFFNVIYADRKGHIIYLFGGQQPVRDGGDWSTYSGILDGGKRSLLWTQTLSWLHLPRAIDPPGGFVANSNNPPWTSTFPQTSTNDPSRFPKYLAPQFMDMRAQHGALYLQAPMPRGLTPKSVLAGKNPPGCCSPIACFPISSRRPRRPQTLSRNEPRPHSPHGTAQRTPQAKAPSSSSNGGQMWSPLSAAARFPPIIRSIFIRRTPSSKSDGLPHLLLVPPADWRTPPLWCLTLSPRQT